MRELASRVDDVANLSRLVHELQRERGTSAIVLGSKGGQMLAELGDQRKRTDAERAKAAISLDHLGQTSSHDLAEVAGKARFPLNELNARRSEIDALGIPVANSSAYYKELIVMTGTAPRRDPFSCGVIGESAQSGSAKLVFDTRFYGDE